jgi:hypothetical protein
LGEAAYQRVVAQLDAFAAKLGIPREIIRQYWSDTAHLPQSLDELKAWGLKPDREYGQVRYDQATGRWTPLGTGPTPGKTAEERGGFPHFITNNVGDAQRFQQVDPQGNIFGGSWDPAANAAHPEWAGRSAAAGMDRGPTQRSASANPYAGTPYEAAWEQANPSGSPGTPTPQSGGVGRALTSAAAGGKSLDQMANELRAANYPGPWDEASVRAAYQRTARPEDQGGGGGGGGLPGSGSYTDLLNQVADTNREKWEFEKTKAQHDMALADTAEKRAQAYQDYLVAQQHINEGQFQDTRYDAQRQTDLARYVGENQYNLNRYDTNAQSALNRWNQQQQFEEGRYDTRRAGDQDRYSTMAQNILKASVDLGSRPEDYFKYNQMLSGGRDILAQLSGNQPTAAFSAPTGRLQAGQVGDVLAALGMTGYGALPHSQDDRDQTEAQWMAARGPGDRPVAGPEPYTPRPDLPFMPAQTDYRVGATQAVPRLKAAYQSLLQQLGVDHLGVDDPRLIDLYKSVTGLDDTGARNVARQAADYFTSTNGQVIPDGVLAGAIAQEHAVQRNTDPGQRTAANMVQAYVRKLTQAGQTGMTADDPRLIAIYRDIGGLDPAAALEAARRSAAYYTAGGVPATGSDLVGIMTEARNRTQAQQSRQSATPVVQRPLVQTAMAASQPSYTSLGWKSGEGYDAVQNPTSGQRYYRTGAGQILDPTTGAEVTPAVAPPPTPPDQQQPDPYDYLQQTRRRQPQLAGAF